MKKIIKYAVISVTLIAFLYILSVTIWKNYFEYYWRTNIVTLYQKDGVIRLCNEVKPLNPSWNATIENRTLLEKAEISVKQGLPITISGRGSISKSSAEVYVDKINKIENGVNLECEKVLKPSFK